MSDSHTPREPAAFRAYLVIREEDDGATYTIESFEYRDEVAKAYAMGDDAARVIEISSPGVTIRDITPYLADDIVATFSALGLDAGDRIRADAAAVAGTPEAR